MEKQYRLRQNGSFQYIYRKGERVTSAHLRLYWVPAHNLKVGVVVSKKIGNSVKRSLVKRRIKESFRTFIPRLVREKNIVLVAKEGIAECSFLEIQWELSSLLAKSRILSNDSSER